MVPYFTICTLNAVVWNRLSAATAVKIIRRGYIAFPWLLYLQNIASPWFDYWLRLRKHLRHCIMQWGLPVTTFWRNPCFRKFIRLDVTLDICVTFNPTPIHVYLIGKPVNRQLQIFVKNICFLFGFPAVCFPRYDPFCNSFFDILAVSTYTHILDLNLLRLF